MVVQVEVEVEVLVIEQLELEPQVKDIMVVMDITIIELVAVVVRVLWVMLQHPQLTVLVVSVCQVQ